MMLYGCGDRKTTIGSHTGKSAAIIAKAHNPMAMFTIDPTASMSL